MVERSCSKNLGLVRETKLYLGIGLGIDTRALNFADCIERPLRQPHPHDARVHAHC